MEYRFVLTEAVFCLPMVRNKGTKRTLKGNVSYKKWVIQEMGKYQPNQHVTCYFIRAINSNPSLLFYMCFSPLSKLKIFHGVALSKEYIMCRPPVGLESNTKPPIHGQGDGH